MLRISLSREFRYIHEPLHANESTLPYLGDENLISELGHRLTYSKGGAFLVSGFRGVGKTTLALRALEKTRHASQSSEIIVPIVLTVARPTTSERLLFTVVRRLFEALEDSGVIHRLHPVTRRALSLAYIRTSMGIKQTQGQSSERGLTFGLGKGDQKVAGWAGYLSPNLSASTKRSRSLAHEMSYLTYSEADVEHDLQRVVGLISQDRENSERGAWIGRILRLPRSKPVRLIVILDEIDKLTVGPSGLAEVESLISGLKNIMATSGIHFVVVAGPDLHDQVVKDASRGNSVYESVFAWRAYVPCNWNAPDQLIQGITSTARLSTGEVGDQSSQLTDFTNYLRYKARGVPRKLLQEFGDFVHWSEDGPILSITKSDEDRIRFYARLEQIVDEFFSTAEIAKLFPVPIDDDRWRLGCYYAIDWILRSEGSTFKVSDIAVSSNDQGLDPLLRIRQREIEQLLNHLVTHGVIDLVHTPGVEDRVIEHAPEVQLPIFKLADDIKRSLLGIAIENEAERAALSISAIYLASGGGIPEPSHVISDRYELIERIALGGMGEVWRGHDRLLRRDVAIKRLIAYGGGDQLLRLGRNEARISARLQHPGLVPTFDVIDRDREGFYIVSELIDGPSLDAVIHEFGEIPPIQAVRLAIPVAETLEYLAGENLIRFDIKPANIMISPLRGPLVIDLALVRDANHTTTDPGTIMGTPIYMAPEVFLGAGPDIRADIYSFGVMLYECLTGKRAFGGKFHDVAEAITNAGINTDGIPGSYELVQIVRTAVARERNERWNSFREIQAALLATPEAKSLEIASLGPWAAFPSL